MRGGRGARKRAKIQSIPVLYRTPRLFARGDRQNPTLFFQILRVREDGTPTAMRWRYPSVRRRHLSGETRQGRAPKAQKAGRSPENRAPPHI